MNRILGYAHDLLLWIVVVFVLLPLFGLLACKLTIERHVLRRTPKPIGWGND